MSMNIIKYLFKISEKVFITREPVQLSSLNCAIQSPHTNLKQIPAFNLFINGSRNYKLFRFFVFGSGYLYMEIFGKTKNQIIKI